MEECKGAAGIQPGNCNKNNTINALGGSL